MEVDSNRNSDLQIIDIDNATLDNFVRKLEEEGIHPILHFGASYSGKTTMLMSLLNYAKNSPKMDIQYDYPDYLGKNPLWIERINEGRSYYELGVEDFARQKLAGSTQKSYTFFIPVRVVIKNEILRFAFLEGNGEWYERKKVIDEASSIFVDFKPEIDHILKCFKKPISVIFVAPAAVTSIENMNTSDEGLANCIVKYRDRVNGGRDNLLLLFSKWDALCNPNDPESGFSTATADVLLKKIRARRSLWARYSALQPRDNVTKSLMPYSAAWIRNNEFVPYDEKFRGIFDKFNKTLWNWLYGNAIAAKSETQPLTRAVLFSDVDNSRGVVSKAYLTLTSAFLWIRPKRPGEA